MDFDKFVKQYYSFGKELGKKCFKDSKKKLGTKRAYAKIYNPVTDWSRFSEFFLVSKILEKNLNDGDKILDLGSPKLFSIWLCTKKRLNLIATDIWDFAVSEYSHFWKEIQNSTNSKISFEQADLLNLQYNDQEFDGIFSVSTIEHAYDENWMKTISSNFSRVLKNDKIVVISTPFGTKSISQYKGHVEYSPSLAKEHDNFFMRIINEQDLKEFIQIAQNYGLFLEESYTVNMKANKLGLLIRCFPSAIRVILGFLKPSLAIQNFSLKKGIHIAENEKYDKLWFPDQVHSDIILVFRKKQPN